MTISTKLYLSALVPVVLAVIAIGGVALSYVSVAELQREQASANRIRTDLGDLNEFARAYLQHHDEGSRQQFVAQSEWLIEELDTFSAGQDDHWATAEEIASDVEQMQTYFADIVANRERGGPVAGEAENRLSALLFIRSNQADETAAQLIASVNDDIAERQRAISASVAAATVLAASLLVGVLLALRAGIVRDLNALVAGTERVGRGDFAHRLGMDRGDELGNVSRAFDHMSERLQDVTVSRSELERALDTTTLLLDASRALAGSLGLDETLRSLSDVVTRVTGRQRVSVEFYDEGTETVTTAHFSPVASITPDQTFTLDELAPQVREAILGKCTTVIDFSDEGLPRFIRERAEAMDYALVAIVPLVRMNRVLGFFRIDDPGERRAFTAHELDLAEGIAAQAAAAIENARLYESERRIAEQLQETLLALPDRVEGVEFAHAYHSATEMAMVGGDFYDIFELDHDRVGVIIGDVAGKGMDAAVLTSLAKNTIRAHASEAPKTPADILRLTNAVLYRSTPPESFITLFFGVLDRRSGRLVYASGGHTSALVIEARGVVHTLPYTGPLLGAFDTATFGEAETLLYPEALLLLYTDGVIESRSIDGMLYGEERLAVAVRQAHHSDPATLVEIVIADVLGFSGGRLNDDLAIFALRRTVDASAAPDQHELVVDVNPRSSE